MLRSSRGAPARKIVVVGLLAFAAFLAASILVTEFGFAAYSAPKAAAPVAGPPARLSVVDLRTLPPARPGKVSQVLPFRYPQGPDALAAAQARARNMPPNLPRSQPFAPLVTTPPTITLGFEAISFSKSGCGCLPPDGDISVGPNHVIGAVNTSFQVYNKSGVALTDAMDFDTFFGSCGAPDLNSSDAITAYDPVADRFTVGILRYDGTTNTSYVSLAVSQSPNPTTTWNKYCFEQPFMGLPALYDFPHISIGQDAIFTTGNVFPSASQQSSGARVNAYDKAAMYSGAITATQIYSDVVLNSDGTPADTLRPALFNVGLPSPTNYFINVAPAPNTRISLWRWTLPFSTNLFVAAGGVDGDPYLPPVPMIQPPPGQPMPPVPFIDARMLGATWHNGTLYATHTIGCSDGSDTTDCVQWYQVGNINAAPSLLQQGIVSGTVDESRAYPNIGVDASGNVRLAYAFSSSTDPLGIRHVGRLAGDPLNTMGTEGVVKTGERALILDEGLRYGDYTGMVTDPDGVRLWHLEEYAPASINDYWDTWISAAEFGPAEATATSTATTQLATSTSTSTSTPLVSTSTSTPILPTSTGTSTVVTSTGTTTATPSRTSTVAVGTQTSTRTATTTAVLPATDTVTASATGTNVAATSTRTAVASTATPGATATACTVKFADVPATGEGATFYSYVRCLACRNIVGGYPCGEPGEDCNQDDDPYYRPGANVSRGQLSKIVANSAGLNDEVAEGQQQFADVEPGDPFYIYVERLAQTGAVSGYPCGESGPSEPCDDLDRPYFRPNNSATRGQISKIVAIAAGFEEEIPDDQQTFTDVSSSSPFWVYIERLASREVISGYGDPEKCPTGTPCFLYNDLTTRGQMAKIAANAFFPDCVTP
ncbi:MAG TPA: S-layer homology domain-containing protein [Chloroflexia bacterium]